VENFEGKTVFITGAGAGLGRATAIAFANAGASLSLIDIDTNGLKETAEKITANNAATPLLLTADLSSRAQCIDAVEKTVQHYDGLDVLCNVAGMLGMSRMQDISEELWNKVISINLSAPFWLSQAAIPHLIKNKGNIVNVASTGGIIGESYLVPYTATKAALMHMTKSMAMEFLKEPIRVNAIAPGGMNTNMANPDLFPQGLDMELVQHFMPKRPPAEPELLAESILYLASDRAANIHGSCLVSDGGHIAG